MPALRLRITGTVQGVFYRAHAKEVADRLDVRGWARNDHDGSVEVHAEGSPEHLKEFEAWCRRGPPAARIEHVEARQIPEEGFVSFEIR